MGDFLLLFFFALLYYTSAVYMPPPNLKCAFMAAFGGNVVDTWLFSVTAPGYMGVNQSPLKVLRFLRFLFVFSGCVIYHVSCALSCRL